MNEKKIQRGITQGYLYIMLFAIGFIFGKQKWFLGIVCILITGLAYFFYDRFDKKIGYKN